MNPRRSLLPLLFVWALIAGPTAQANPAGEQVVSGSVHIERLGPNMVIEAGHGSAVNWRGGFSIDRGESVQIIQPCSRCTHLARDTSLNATRIDGMLTANGLLTIANPYGIYFGNEAIVDVGHLVAAAGQISTDDFLAGRLHFHGLAGNVENHGLIQAQNVALLGRRVANHGQIVSQDGSILLLAGDQIWLTSWESPVRVSLGPLEGPEPAVHISGELDARRGRIQIAAGDALGLAIQSQGDLRGANIALESQGGNVEVSGGTLDASDEREAAHGGHIEITGEQVAIDHALLDASGDGGGGEILVGGDYQGANPDVPNARRTFIGKQATLRADALTQGNGGKVIVWADEATGFQGEITARGGRRGGRGGFVETSSKGYLEVIGGSVDASALEGPAGEWLLDPRNVVIADQTSSGGSFSGANPDVFTPDASPVITEPAVVDRNTIQNALNSGTSVTVTTTETQLVQEGDITVVDSVSSDVPDGTTATLTLTADRDIAIEAPIRDAEGNGNLELVLNANETIALGASIEADTVTASTDSQGTGSITDASPSEDPNITANTINLSSTEIGGQGTDEDLDLASVTDLTIEATGSVSVAGDNQTKLRRLSLVLNPLATPVYSLSNFANLPTSTLLFEQSETSAFPNDFFLFPDFVATDSSPVDFSLVSDQHLQVSRVFLPQGLAETSTATLSSEGRIIGYDLGVAPRIQADTIDLSAESGIFGSLLFDPNTETLTEFLGINASLIRATTNRDFDSYGIFLFNQPESSSQDVTVEQLAANEGDIIFAQTDGGSMTVSNGASTNNGDLNIQNFTGDLTVNGVVRAQATDESQAVRFGNIDLAAYEGDLALAADTSTDGGDVFLKAIFGSTGLGGNATITGDITTTRDTAASENDTGGLVSLRDVVGDIQIDSAIKTGGGDFFVDNRAIPPNEGAEFKSGASGSIDTRLFRDNNPVDEVLNAGTVTIRSEYDIEIGGAIHGDTVEIASDGETGGTNPCVDSSVCFVNNPVIQARGTGSAISPTNETFTGIRLQAGIDPDSESATGSVDATGAQFWGLDPLTTPGDFSILQNAPIVDADLPEAVQFGAGSAAGLRYKIVSQVADSGGGATITLASPSKFEDALLTLVAPEDVDLQFSSNPLSLESLTVNIVDAPDSGFVVDSAFTTGVDSEAIVVTSNKDLIVDTNVTLGGTTTQELGLIAGSQTQNTDLSGGNLTIKQGATLAANAIDLVAQGTVNSENAQIVLESGVKFQQDPAADRAFRFAQTASVESANLPAALDFVDSNGTSIGVEGVAYSIESAKGAVALTDASQIERTKLAVNAETEIDLDTPIPIPLLSAEFGRTGDFIVTSQLIDKIDLLPGPDNALTLHAGTSLSGTLSFLTPNDLNIDADRIVLRAGPGTCAAGTICRVAFPTTSELQFRNEDGTAAPFEFVLNAGNPITPQDLPAASLFEGSVGPTELFEIQSDYIQPGADSVTLGQPAEVPGTASSILRVSGDQIRFTVTDQDLDMGTIVPRDIELEGEIITLEALSSGSSNFKVLAGNINRIRGRPNDDTPIEESRPRLFTHNQSGALSGVDLAPTGAWYQNAPEDVVYSVQSQNSTLNWRGFEDRLAGSDLVAQVFNDSSNPIDLGQGLSVRSLEARSNGAFNVNPTTSDTVSVESRETLVLVAGCADRFTACTGAGNLVLDKDIALRAPFISLGAGGATSTGSGSSSKVIVDQNSTVSFELDSENQSLFTIFDINQSGDVASADLPLSNQFTLIDGATNPQGVDQIDAYQLTSYQGSVTLEPSGASAGISDVKAEELLVQASAITIRSPELGDAELERTQLGGQGVVTESILLEATAGSVDATSPTLFLLTNSTSETPPTFSIKQTDSFNPSLGTGGLPQSEQFLDGSFGLNYQITSDGGITIPSEVALFYSPVRSTNLRLQVGSGEEIRWNGILFLNSLLANPDPAITGTRIVFDVDRGEFSTVETALGQSYASPITLAQDTLLEAGGGVQFTSTIDAATPGGAGLRVLSGQTIFVEDDVGASQRLSSFSLDFAPGLEPITQASFGAPSSVEPIAIRTVGDIELFPTARSKIPKVATLYKATTAPSGTTPDLLFSSSEGSVVMGRGQKLSVPGILAIEAADQIKVGDLSAVTLKVDAPKITLIRRKAGKVLLRNGKEVRDAGVDYVANRFVFCATHPGCKIRLGGTGNRPTFGLPNPFLRPNFLTRTNFPAAAINAQGLPTDRAAFFSEGGTVLDRTPLGASSSDLAEAFWIPVPTPLTAAPPEFLVPDPAPLIEIGIAALPTSALEYQSRLYGAGILDDVDSGVRLASAPVWVSEGRILAKDANQALAAYGRVLGPQRGNAGEIRRILQAALDDYRSLTGARRVVGFEFRRYIKNRPSSQFAAYTALEDLDSLFVHQRRSGLVPSEFEHVQREWLAEVVPEGITIDELSQAVFPSRYVRGSEILDVYGE